MRTLSIVITFLFFSTNSFSQDNRDSLFLDNSYFIRYHTKEYIYNQVYKNIAAFNIKYASQSLNNLPFNDRFRVNNDFFYQNLMPDYGYKLDMDIEKSDSLYPNPRYHLYKIYLKSFNWIPENPKMREVRDSTIRTTHNFLIAFNEGNGDTKFISGQFIRSYISSDFHLDKEDPETFIPYLTFRSYDVGGVNIKFKKEKHKVFIFEGYSEIYKKPLLITVDRRDFDNAQIFLKRN